MEDQVRDRSPKSRCELQWETGLRCKIQRRETMEKAWLSQKQNLSPWGGGRFQSAQRMYCKAHIKNLGDKTSEMLGLK